MLIPGFFLFLNKTHCISSFLPSFLPYLVIEPRSHDPSPLSLFLLLAELNSLWL
jgi:hypothetical protein